MPFPPRPRAWAELVDHIIAGAADSVSALQWQAVHADGLDHPWVGVQAPALDGLRTWQWDVVTPEDHAGDDLLRLDPLTLCVEQDMMVIDMHNALRPNVQVRMQVPVRHVPDTIDVRASALPPPPWQVELSTGWSTAQIAGAVGSWLHDHVGRAVTLSPGRERPPELTPSEDRFVIGENLWVTGDAFDGLLSMDPADAGIITQTLMAMVEAIEPHR